MRVLDPEPALVCRTFAPARPPAAMQLYLKGKARQSPRCMSAAVQQTVSGNAPVEDPPQFSTQATVRHVAGGADG